MMLSSHVYLRDAAYSRSLHPFFFGGLSNWSTNSIADLKRREKDRCRRVYFMLNNIEQTARYVTFNSTYNIMAYNYQ